MPRTKKILTFLVCFVLIYTVLAIPWPGVAQGYAAFYRAAGNLLFYKFGSYGTALFRPKNPHTQHIVTEVVLTSRNPGDSTRRILDMSSRYIGYRPTITLIALALATPLPWKRRAFTLLWGLVLINGFIFFRTALYILSEFAGEINSPSPAGPIVRAMLKCAMVVLHEAPISFLLVPVLIWALLSFRRDDWAVVGIKRNPTAERKSSVDQRS